MNLNKIRSGEVTVLDANILIYAMQQSSQECKRLLSRCAQEEITGILPTHILAEIMHLVMIAEARDNGWIKGPNPARQLAEQPDRVRQLVRYEGIMRDILAIGLLVEPLVQEDFISALAIQRQTGLLTNDALLVAVAQRLRANSITSADQSFANVQGMIQYVPDDIET